MESKKVESFLKLTGAKIPEQVDFNDNKTKELGARILLSEVLEYLIDGLGIELSYNGTIISDPEGVEYKAKNPVDAVAALDGMADIAYTMYWNALRFGLPIEKAFERVCDNNLEKFILLNNNYNEGDLLKEDWHCNQNISWPEAVTKVEVVKVDNNLYAVGKDSGGKVRKPSSYKSVILDDLVR